MLKAVSALLVVMSVVCVSWSRAHACSCAPPRPPAEALAAAAAVFEGEVLEDRVTSVVGTTRAIQMRVLRAWKGVTADDVVSVDAAASSAACGYDTPRDGGTLMLVYANGVEGKLTTNLCTRTALSAEAAADFSALGVPATVGSGDAGSSSDGGPVTPSGQKTDNGCAVGGPSPQPTSLTLAMGVLAAALAAAARPRRRAPLER